MRILLLTSFFIFSIFAQENFTNKQWYLQNNGSEIDYRTTFHDIKPRATKKGFDIKLNQFYQAKPELKRDILVAVIDSGVNFDHPDLKHAIFKNKKECDDKGDIKFQVDQDIDKNGYPGDCSGWNFVSLTDGEIKKLLSQPRFKNLKPAAKMRFEKELRQLRRQPFDTDGHGTHVAGLIAAKRNNGLGIDGISDRIKILPIKVFESTNSLTNKFVQVISGSMVQKKPLSTIMIQAINYAIRMRADVINMSLGWNKFSMTKKLEEVIYEALKRNITIVTSADNGGSNDSTFPCRIPGVICVGATNPFGEISKISNYGHNVDILAPGEHILSLFPVDDDPLEFPVAGYEMMSGTSQAAPLISGAISLLKMMNPRIGPLDLKRKLLNGTDDFQSTYEVDTSVSGMVNFEKLISGDDDKLKTVFPNFKRTREFVYNLRRKTILGAISFENLSKNEVTKNIRVKSLNKLNPFEVQKEVKFLPYSLQDIKISIPVDNVVKTSADLKLEVIIDGIESMEGATGNPRKYVIKYPVSTFLNFGQLEKKAITASDLEKIKKSATDNLVPVIRNSGDPHFYYSTTLVENKGLEVHLFEENDKQFFSRRKFFLDKPSSEDVLSKSKLTSVIYEDMNGDGKKDFLFFSLHTEENKKNRSKSELYWQYTYLDEELKPLYKKQTFFKYVPPRSTFPNEFQTELEDLIFTIPRKIEDLSFLEQSVEGIGKVAFPIFFQANSFVPYYQQSTTTFDRIKVEAADQIFYLKLEEKDEEKYLVTYALLTDEFHKKLTGLRNNLKPIEVVGPIRNNESCQKQKAICFYLVHGNTFYRKMSLLRVLPNLEMKTEPVPMNIEGVSRFIKGQNLSFAVPRSFGDRYLEIQEGKTSLLLKSHPKGLKEHSLKVSSLGRTSLATFENNNRVIKLELDGNYVYRLDNTGELKAKWKNYSFLGMKEQVELYEPVFLQKKNRQLPAILWDAQFLTENSLRLAYFSESDIFTPLQYAVKVPSNCQRMSSRFSSRKGHYEIPFLCTTKDEKEASLFLMNLNSH